MVWRLCALALVAPTAALRALSQDVNHSALRVAVDKLRPSDRERELVMREFPDLVAQMFRGPMCYDFNLFTLDDLTVLPRCTVGSKSSCPVSAMKGNTIVYPGGKTRCMDSKYHEYAFQVFPGSSKKLFILFDGGGASWDAMSAALNTANKTRVTPVKEIGLMRNDPRNPVADYTKILIQYCSGDLHAGNKTQTYKDGKNNLVVQMGYHNTLAALNWAKANVDSQLDNLVVSGMSAGAIGAEVWSKKILGMFSYKSARILADSYIPIFPERFQGVVFEGLGVCTTDLVKGMEETCLKKQLVIEDMFVAAMEEFPNVGFASLTSTEDWGQTLYYQLTAMTRLRGLEALGFTKMAFHEKACKMLTRYDKNKNFVAFLRTDNLHVYSLCDDVFDYTEMVTGHKVSLMSWMRTFIEEPYFKGVANPLLGPAGSCHQLLNKKVGRASAPK